MKKLNLRFVAILMISGLLCTARAFSQAQAITNNGLALPSANNSFLNNQGAASAGGVSVDQYTGTLVAEVPIYTLAAKETAIAISLNYVGGRGIRLQDYASSVGLGWQLNAGGSITRIVRGFPDEGTSGYVGGGWGNIIDGWTGWSTNPTLGNITSAQLIALAGLSTGMPTADGEPDIFNISTPFFSAQFVWNGNGVPVFSNATDLSITYNSLAGSFVVKDGQGNQYFFGSSSNSVEKVTTSIYGTSPPAFTTSWYLDKIVMYNSRDVINLAYLSAPGNDINYHYQWTEVSDLNTHFTFDSTALTTTISNPKYVSVISTSLGEADFSYVLDRSDDVNAERLSGIVIKAYNPQTGTNSTALQSFRFNTSYFGSPSADHDILRLRLDNINWELHTLYNSPAFDNATFYYGGNTYKGFDIFRIKL